MAEPTLSIRYSDLVQVVLSDRGWGITAEYATGTIAIAAGAVTLTGGTFPSGWSIAGTLVVNGTAYAVSTRNSGTSLTLTDTSVTVSSGASYALYNLTAEETAQLLRIIKMGERKFYLARDGYRWSFLDPLSTMATVAPYSTGTISITLGVVTLSGGTWPSWAASGDLIYGGKAYSVNSKDSGTQITLDDLTLTGVSAADYSIAQQVYDLPADFGGLQGAITYRPGDSPWWQELVQRADVQIRSYNSFLMPTAAAPRYYAIRPKSYTGGTTTGQRWEILFDTWPDAVYTIQYRYRVEPNATTPANQYPYGGPYHAETLLAAVRLAIAEVLGTEDIAVRKQAFDELLVASMQLDQQEMVPDQLGSAVRQSEVYQGQDLWSDRRRTGDLISVNI